MIEPIARDWLAQMRGRLAAMRPWLPLGALAGATLPLLEHPGWMAWSGWATVAACILLSIAIDRSARPMALGLPATGLEAGSEPDEDSPLQALLHGVLPVWAGHVGSARSQTEEAVTELANSFASINRRFEAAGFGDRGADSETTFGLLKLCERELTPVVSSMQRILDSKNSLVGSIGELTAATDELRQMAGEVGSIAAHTNMLAINAAIEAAHAGPSGRGFSVIAKEIRVLSQTSADSGKRIAQRMEEVERLMRATVEAADQASEHDRVAIELSGSVIGDVLSHVKALGEGAEAMRTHGVAIRGDTERLLVNLQFQDRVSQIISVVDGDMRRLQALLGDAERSLPSAESWLAATAARYTMHDQRSDAGVTSGDTVADEVVFF